MSTVFQAGLVSAASAIVGVLVGGFLDGRRAGRAREYQERTDLDARLTAFTSALEAFSFEAQRLPPQSRQDKLVNEWLKRRTPTLDYFFTALNRALLGRRLYATMHDFQRAGTALLLGSPPEVLRGCELIADCLAKFEAGSPDFDRRLRAARSDFIVVARLVVTGELHPPLSRRLWRWLRRSSPALELPRSIARPRLGDSEVPVDTP
jgi:hypothetical protein